MEIVLYGGLPYWIDEDEEYDPLLERAHEKFLGDGALYVWTASRSAPIGQKFTTELMNRLRTLALRFEAVERSSLDKVPVAIRPKRIRFGLSAGKVHELKRIVVRRAPHEFAGICINLASRLQSYCPGVSMIASARLGLTAMLLKRHGYVRVLARKIKGFAAEPVIVDRSEFQALSPRVSARYFAAE
jgi:class 3 adenylate cyclase